MLYSKNGGDEGLSEKLPLSVAKYWLSKAVTDANFAQLIPELCKSELEPEELAEYIIKKAKELDRILDEAQVVEKVNT